MTTTNFNPFPVLRTERLTLRQLTIDDGQDIFDLRSNPEINKYLSRTPSKTIEDAINFINIINENIKQNNSIYWVITLNETNAFVGTICLFDFSEDKKSCEIGYELLTKFQGQGLMKEAIQEVINYAFNTLKFEKIIAFTHNDNINSTKLLMNCGFIKSMEAMNESNDFSLFYYI